MKANYMQVIPNSLGCVNGHKGIAERWDLPNQILCVEKGCSFNYQTQFNQGVIMRKLPEQTGWKNNRMNATRDIIELGTNGDTKPTPVKTPDVPKPCETCYGSGLVGWSKPLDMPEVDMPYTCPTCSGTGVQV